MTRRVLLFLLTNLLVVVGISIMASLLGVNRYLTPYGLDYRSLAAFCLLWGMGGAFISLMLSRFVAKRAMRVHVIDPNRPDDAGAAELVRIVHDLARKAGIEVMPEVGIYESPEVNAFATGPTRNRALVAVSTGLLQRMGRDEIIGVLGHEVAHVANGDMVTMTLVQGVVNSFVMFLARIAAFAVETAMRGGKVSREPSFIRPFLVLLFDILFGVLGSIVVCWVSRVREYRADQGGANLAGQSRMIGALSALARDTSLVDTRKGAYQSLKISGGRGGIMALFLTHPPLEKRIARLREAAPIGRGAA